MQFNCSICFQKIVHYLKLSMRLRPSDILFSQDSISDKFKTGESLPETFEELLYGVHTPNDIMPIRVVRWKGNWWSLTGERRLYLYKLLEKLGIFPTIPVIELCASDPVIKKRFKQRKTTVTNGKTIRINEVGAFYGSKVEQHISYIIACNPQFTWNDSRQLFAGISTTTVPDLIQTRQGWSDFQRDSTILMRHQEDVDHLQVVQQHNATPELQLNSVMKPISRRKQLATDRATAADDKISKSQRVEKERSSNTNSQKSETSSAKSYLSYSRTRGQENPTPCDLVERNSRLALQPNSITQAHRSMNESSTHDSSGILTPIATDSAGSASSCSLKVLIKKFQAMSSSTTDQGSFVSVQYTCVSSKAEALAAKSDSMSNGLNATTECAMWAKCASTTNQDSFKSQENTQFSSKVDALGAKSDGVSKELNPTTGTISKPKVPTKPVVLRTLVGKFPNFPASNTGKVPNETPDIVKKQLTPSIETVSAGRMTDLHPRSCEIHKTPLISQTFETRQKTPPSTESIIISLMQDRDLSPMINERSSFRDELVAAGVLKSRTSKP